MHRLLPFFLLVALTAAAFAQDRTNARSMVISPYGIVATSQVQASQAGAEILSRGGSAADAAIAANAVLGVMEPDMNGMGGDLFAIYWDAKTGKLYGLNSSGWAPKALTIAHIKAMDATQMPVDRHRLGHRPRRCRGMEQTARAFRPLALERSFCPRNLLRAERIRRAGVNQHGLGRLDRQTEE